MITCRFEDGVAAGPLRHVGVAALIVRGDEVLLARRAATMQMEPGKLTIPGGFMDRDESLVAAARREAREETGYDVVIDQLFMVWDSQERRSDVQNVGFFFLAHPTDTPPVAFDHETSEVVWTPFNQLPPADEISFSHHDILKQYSHWRLDPFALPILSSLTS